MLESIVHYDWLQQYAHYVDVYYYYFQEKRVAWIVMLLNFDDDFPWLLRQAARRSCWIGGGRVQSKSCVDSFLLLLLLHQGNHLP
jgi:hypothetical protein